MPKLKTSEKLVQQKLSGIFTSTKRDKAEKDKPKKNQIIEKSKRECPTVVVNEEISTVSTFVEQKSHALDHQRISVELDESENEAFVRDDLINDVVTREASTDLENDPEELLRNVEIRSKLSKLYHN
jgi:hypothetical protein